MIHIIRVSDMKIKKKIVVTNNFKETQKLARDFAKTLKKGDLICLSGNLGSGKTTFVQGLAEGLGIKNRIISPTFIIVRAYRIKNDKSRIMNFYHVDLYRVENERDLEDLGIEEIINDKNNITVIEWAEKLKSQISTKRINIQFSYEKENTRRIIFSPSNQ